MTCQGGATDLGEGDTKAVTNVLQPRNEGGSLTGTLNADRDWSGLVNTVGAELKKQTPR